MPASLAPRLRFGLAAGLVGLLGLAGLLAAAQAAGPATVLYDGGLGSPPEAQGLAYADPSGLAGHAAAGGATTLDTMLADALQAGYSLSPTLALTLDRAAGYQVIFTAQVLTEAHASPHRAGVSLIVLSSDRLGIELGFWLGRVWAQEGGSAPQLFTQAEGAALDTSTPLTYTLRVQGAGYVLAAGLTPVLTGTLRDYTAFTGFPDVYETPNFIFLGDDTTSARGAVRFSWVAVAALEAAPTATPSPTMTATHTPTPTATPSATATAPPGLGQRFYLPSLLRGAP
ncbi:MAG: hypothetical protein JNK29_16650 [Anaerolineales bacterium]|nr:hypothetical protein [Anaerolineales bacterium]